MILYPDIPMPTDLIIKNARVVNEHAEFEADVAVASGRIEAIGPDLAVPGNATVIDAAGNYLLPGMIDDQVHFREPGLTHKGDICSESRAAVAGGVTSYMEMPNTQPQTTTLDLLEEKYARAAAVSAGNFSFYRGATNDNLEEIKRIDNSRVCGLKVFMGSSTGNMLVDDEQTLRAIFSSAPCVITTHCESTPMINANLQRAVAQYGNRIPVSEHPQIRNRETCLVSSTLAVKLAKEYGSQLHLLHLSTADELALLDQGPVPGKHITAEVCAHYLHFDSADYAQLGNFIKCNPAVKSADDRSALIRALAEQQLDVIATDHAPHTLEEKAQEDYRDAPAGLPLAQFVLPASLELVQQGHLSIADVVEKTSHNVAERFRIRERGFIREGFWADFVIADDKGPYPVSREQVISKCGWSPFENRSFQWRINTTVVSGAIAWHNGKIYAACRGQRLEFDW
jgi:dihydroorotase